VRFVAALLSTASVGPKRGFYLREPKHNEINVAMTWRPSPGKRAKSRRRA
jgi:hypothetical protein